MTDDALLTIVTVSLVAFVFFLALGGYWEWRRRRSEVPHPERPVPARSVSLPAITPFDDTGWQNRYSQYGYGQPTADEIHQAKVAATLKQLGVTTVDDHHRG